MIPRIEILAEKKLIGRRMTISLADNKTSELWQDFMHRRKEIKNIVGTDLFSIQFYDPSYFRSFNPASLFEKWAAIEVEDYGIVPDGMETLLLEGGLYAVFTYKGSSGKAAELFRYIFSKWLPDSEFVLDNRPHFEVLGTKYRNNDPGSEEEIWIPVKKKNNHLP
jgi:AraC family transcriptional regulator